MKRTFEFEYPDGMRFTAAWMQKMLCKLLGAPIHVRDVTPEVEPETKHEVAMQLLRWLAQEHRVASFHEGFQMLFDDGLLIHRTGDDYAISDKGRAALEKAGG